MQEAVQKEKELRQEAVQKEKELRQEAVKLTEKELQHEKELRQEAVKLLEKEVQKEKELRQEAVKHEKELRQEAVKRAEAEVDRRLLDLLFGAEYDSLRKKMDKAKAKVIREPSFLKAQNAFLDRVFKNMIVVLGQVVGNAAVNGMRAGSVKSSSKEEVASGDGDKGP